MATSQDFVNWVCSDHLEKRYLKHVLLAETEALRRFAYGTTHTTIYYPEVKAFHIAYPPPREQRAIADVLDALDDKIESNERLVARLTEVARLVYERAVIGAPLGTLGDLGTVVGGGTPRSAVPEFWSPEEVPWITPSE
jgi:type I restriction enzyme S subunit